MPRARGIFITGTDTGVGKTIVAAGILRLLRELGIDAVPMKPVQTGARREGDRLVAPDLEFCLSAAGLRPSVNELKLMLPYAYEPACSPHLAGRLAGNYPQITRITRSADKLLEKHQAIVVEGAGGVLVPLNKRQTMLDLMAELNYPVVLAARYGLGTINHTLLSIKTLRTAGLNLLGVVFNRTEPPQPENELVEADNPEAIAAFGDVSVLGKLGYFKNMNLANKRVWQSYKANTPGLIAVLNKYIT